MKRNHNYLFLCSAVLLLGLLLFLFFIDRYPAFYFDEPIFNASAARYVSGQPFNYVLHSAAPHDAQVWAHHGPFYSRMQVPVFKLFGISHFSSRIPGYLAGHLAIALLCFLFLRTGYGLAALVVSLCWLGDPISLQLHLGRPEGMGMLFSILGFICLINAISGRSVKWFAGTSLFIGMAVGFNPATSFYALSAVGVILITQPRGRLLSTFKYLVIGSVAPVALMFICWLPNIRSSLEQLAWFVTYSITVASGHKVARLKQMIMSGHLGVYWGLCLNLVSVVYLLPVWISTHFWHTSKSRDEGHYMGMSAMIFAFAGVVIYLRSSMHPYYLLYLTPWPIVSLMCLFRRRSWKGFRASIPALAVCILLSLSWVAGSFWKASRVKEAYRSYEKLDKAELTQAIRRHVPEHAELMGDPVFYVEAFCAGRTFTPLPFFHNDAGMRVPEHVWLAIRPRYVDILNNADKTILARRELVGEGDLFSGVAGHEESYRIFAPAELY